MNESAAVFSMPVTVDPGDIDALGHVNNTVYLRWVQDVAARHWAVLAPPEVHASVVWVVLRHEIDYTGPAQDGDRLTVDTWVGPATGLRFERNTEVRRAQDGRLLAKARTLWCPIDRATGRPVRRAAELQTILTRTLASP